MTQTETRSGFPIGTWFRTCTECGHMQRDNEPPQNKDLTDAYRNRKCKKCRSEALDYGTTETGPWNPDEDWNQ